ncbi:hypothetical protein N6H14_15930 [Paenibacillus sp. CC-CFT747]|nr:hypothetical protein N6H14_15930 [Paenibacillus sp. CC-CFT747]
MYRAGISVIFLCWTAVLILELITFYKLLQRPHLADEVIFILTVIGVTVAIGYAALGVLTKRQDR